MDSYEAKTSRGDSRFWLPAVSEQRESYRKAVSSRKRQEAPANWLATPSAQSTE